MAACSSVSTATYSVNSVFGPLQSTVFYGSTHYTHTHVLLSVHVCLHTHTHTHTHTNMQNSYTADPDIIIMVDRALKMNYRSHLYQDHTKHTFNHGNKDKQGKHHHFTVRLVESAGEDRNHTPLPADCKDSAVRTTPTCITV